MGYRRRSAPVSTLRTKLQQRLVEKGNEDSDGDLILNGESFEREPFFPGNVLGTMHRYFLLKSIIAATLIFFTAMLIQGGYRWGTSLLQVLHSVVEWDLAPGVFIEKVEPAFRLFFDHLELPAIKEERWAAGRQTLPVSGSLQSGFGLRSDSKSGREEMHYGIDLIAPEGTAVKALLKGRVEQVISGGDGVTIVILSKPGWNMIYRGLAAAAVEEEAEIEQGALLGKLGPARRYEQPHLHFELRYKGRPVPPPAGWVTCFASSKERV